MTLLPYSERVRIIVSYRRIQYNALWFTEKKNVVVLFHLRRPMINVVMTATILTSANDSISPNARLPDDEPKEVAPCLSSMP